MKSWPVKAKACLVAILEVGKEAIVVEEEGL
jgi:hypothetical protein